MRGPRRGLQAPARRSLVGGPQLAVGRVSVEQLLVAALRLDPALGQERDRVAAGDGRQAVRDGDDGAAAGELGDRRESASLGGGVEGRRRLVEHDDGRVLEQCPRDGDALALAPGQLRTAGAEAGAPARGQAVRELVELGVASDALDLLIARVRTRDADVLEQGRLEDVLVLLDERHQPGEVGRRDVAHIDAPDPDRALAAVVEPGQQPCERRLAAAGRADERRRRALRDPQVDAVDRDLVVAVAEDDAGELDVEAIGEAGLRPLRQLVLRQEALHGGRRELNPDHDRGERADQGDDGREIGEPQDQEQHDGAEIHLVGDVAEARRRQEECDGQCGGRVHGGDQPSLGTRGRGVLQLCAAHHRVPGAVVAGVRAQIAANHLDPLQIAHDGPVEHQGVLGEGPVPLLRERHADPGDDHQQHQREQRHEGEPPVDGEEDGGRRQRDRGCGRAVGDAVGERLLDLLHVVVQHLLHLAAGPGLHRAERHPLELAGQGEPQVAECAVGGHVARVGGGAVGDGAHHEGRRSPQDDRRDAPGVVAHEEGDRDGMDRDVGGE